MNERKLPPIPFFACRAFEVARLTREQIEILQDAEATKNLGCLFPAAIQELFKLESLKAHYKVPSGTKPRDRAASDHWRQCISQIISAGLTSGFNPPAGCITHDKISVVHEFDKRVFAAAQAGRIGFLFDQNPQPPRPMYDPDLFRPGRSSRLLHTDQRTAAGDGYPS